MVISIRRKFRNVCSVSLGMLFLTLGSSFSARGEILHEYWSNIPGPDIPDLTNHVNYPDNPSGSSSLSIFEGPTNWNDEYGARIRGFVHPPQDGYYIFWIACDNDCELRLSSDDKQSNSALIAGTDGWTDSRQWDKYPSQQSDSVFLEAGKRYYVEALHKENTGGDNVAVGWRLADGSYERPIPGYRLSPVTDDEDYSLWSSRADITINTAPLSGMTQDVADYPLLVRLTSSNFDFSQAKPDGGDIRFSLHDGAHLPYAIDNWDGGSADIWVLVDTVYSGNSTQLIHMYWGNAGAVSRSNRAAVFTTDNGLQSAWPLDEDPSGTAPQMQDRTQTGNHAAVQGGIGASGSIPGVIGPALSLDGVDDYLSTAIQYHNPAVMSISAWFKTTTTSGGKLFGFGSGMTGSSGNYDRHIWMDDEGRLHFGIWTGSARHLEAVSTLNDGVWHHFTAVLDDSTMELYINGASAASQSCQPPQEYAGFWRIGYDDISGWPDAPSSAYFEGALDEVSVHATALNGSTAALNHASRRPGSNLLTITSPDILPSLRLSREVSGIRESGNDTLAFTVHASLPAPQISNFSIIAKLTIAGSAENGVDYAVMPANVLITIPADSLTAVLPVVISPIDDNLDEGSENFHVTLNPDSAYRITGMDTVNIPFIDDDLVEPPVITAHPVSRSAQTGDTPEFNVALSGTPPFTYQWRKNGVPEGPSLQSYALPPVSLSDNGASIDVIITNSLASDTSNPALLSVSERPTPPVIHRHPLGVTVSQGEEAVFTIYATGTPPLTYQWYAGDSAVSGATDTLFTAGPLQQADNETVYTCRVTGPGGVTASLGAVVTVKRPSSRMLVLKGELHDSDNNLVGVDAPRDMDFQVRLYPGLTSSTPVYTETFLDDDEQAIRVASGKFVIRLGEGRTADDLLAVVRENTDLYAEFAVTRPGGNPETLLPRVPLTASPYALSGLAETIKGNVDPLTAGIQAPVGTYYIDNSTGDTYVKTHNTWVKAGR